MVGLFITLLVLFKMNKVQRMMKVESKFNIDELFILSFFVIPQHHVNFLKESEQSSNGVCCCYSFFSSEAGSVSTGVES